MGSYDGDMIRVPIGEDRDDLKVKLSLSEDELRNKESQAYVEFEEARERIMRRKEDEMGS